MKTCTTAIDRLRETLPPTFARKAVGDLTGGIVQPATVANQMSRGEGPSAFYVGRKACFERESFLAWLETRMSSELKDGK